MPDIYSEKLDRSALEKMAYEWREKQATLEAENADLKAENEDMKNALEILGVIVNG